MNRKYDSSVPALCNALRNPVTPHVEASLVNSGPTLFLRMFPKLAYTVSTYAP